MAAIISTVANVVTEGLFLLIRAYDKYMYTPIQWISAPVVRKIPRHAFMFGAERDVFTANNVTFARTVLFVPMAWFLKYGYHQAAFWCILLHDYLDHLDGIVAKEHKAQGYKDDPVLGCFLDAFCDKVVNTFAYWSVLLLTDYTHMSYFQVTIYVLFIGSILLYEGALAVTRTQDYYHAVYVSGPGGRNLAASMAGKLKEKLESMSIMFLCLAQQAPNPFDHWGGPWAMGCLAISVWMAHESLAHKMRGRQSAEAPETTAPKKETGTENTGKRM